MKNLLLVFFGIASLAVSAQSVGVIGSATPTGWDSDTDMATSDNISYSITIALTAGELKFRQDDSWTVNWGGSGFPSGTAVSNGPNISVPAGTYTITFNRNTLQYSFSGSTAFPSIGIWGPAVDAINGFGGPDVDMTTTDGIHYILSAFYFTSGNAKFRQDDNPSINWASTSFPSGVGIQDGPNFYVPGGLYTVTFNRETGEYFFGAPSIGIIGSSVIGWDNDVDMVTSDGDVYVLTNYTLQDGELKFRQDDSWTANWGWDGSTSGIAVLNGQNIPVTAGTYDIIFRRGASEYELVPSTMGVIDAQGPKLIAYPNPSKDFWNFTSTAASQVLIYDILGKLLYSGFGNSVDATSFSPGVYLAKVSLDGVSHDLRLIKQN